MCGRYKLDIEWSRIWTLYKLSDQQQDAARSNALNTVGHFNIAPTSRIVVIRQGDGGPEATTMRWGLVPSWAKDMKGPLNNNARADGVAEKPSFKRAFAKRRCLIPADGYYEWQTVGKEKLPWLHEIHGGELFSFAGLWEAWKQPDGEILESCAIITTEANAVAAQVHDRMPVILSPDNYATWLSHETPIATVKALLTACPEDWLTARRVSTKINNVRNQGAAALAD